MDYKRELELLKSLKYQIKNEKDIKIKNLLIRDYTNILSYLDKLKIINAEQESLKSGINFENFYNELILYQNNYAEQFLNNFGLIEFIINNLLEIYKQYPLKECDSFCNPIDIEEGLELVDAFFGSLGNDFYQLFTKIMEEKRISYKNNLPEYGITYNAGYTDGQYIVLKKEDKEFDYEFLSALVHEIGHCYQFNLNKCSKTPYVFNLLTEVESLTMQKLFDEFVIKNHSYKEKALYSSMNWQETLYQRTLVDDFINKALNKDMVESLDVYTGNFELNKNKDILNLITPFNSNALSKFDLSLDNYLYVISDFVANNFVKMYQESPIETLKIFRKFIINLNNASFKENIGRYGNDFSMCEVLIKRAHEFQKKK